MPKGRIRIKLKSYDHHLIDDTCQKIVDTAIRTGASISGPIPLPTKNEVFVVNRSPFKHKDARDHFGLKTHKRLIDIINASPKAIDALMSLKLPAGVDIEIKM